MFFAAGALLVFVMYSLVGWAIKDAWPPPEDVDPLIRDWWAALRGQSIEVAQRYVLERSLMALLGVGILALILGYVVADRALRPVMQMTATARKLSETSLAHERIDLQGPDDELKELADTFDAMLARLNSAFDAQRRFVGNASHELRTPLAINRTVLEVALSDPAASADLKVLGRTLLGTNARHERLIEGLLLLARSERELSVRKAVDVQDVAKTAVDQLAPFADRAGRGRRVRPAPRPGHRRSRAARTLRQQPGRERDQVQQRVRRKSLGAIGNRGRGIRCSGRQHRHSRPGLRGRRALRALPAAAPPIGSSRPRGGTRAVHRARHRARPRGRSRRSRVTAAASW